MKLLPVGVQSIYPDRSGGHLRWLQEPSHGAGRAAPQDLHAIVDCNSSEDEIETYLKFVNRLERIDPSGRHHCVQSTTDENLPIFRRLETSYEVRTSFKNEHRTQENEWA